MKAITRLNVNITTEAYDILKIEADRLGMTMGNIVTLMALEREKQGKAIDGLDTLRLVKQEMDKLAQTNAGGTV